MANNKLVERAARNLGLKSLFHYRGFNADHLVALVTDGTLRFSNPANFNDPWECRPHYSLGSLDTAEGRERHIQWLQNVSKEHARQQNKPVPPREKYESDAKEMREKPGLLRALVEQLAGEVAAALRAKYRVFCLATKPDIPLMWSYYGDHHRGICLRFGTKGVFADAYRVNYSKDYPVRDITDADEYSPVVDSLLTKAKVWEHEGEFRALNREGGMEGHPECKDGYVKTSLDDLEAVVMGCQISDESRHLVEAIIESAGRRIDLFRCRLVPGHFHLDIEKL